MDSKRKVVIETPRGTISTKMTKNGTVTSKLTWNPGCKPSLENSILKTQGWIDSEVLRRCAPLVPFRTGVLQKSGNLSTTIGSAIVRYKTPYARAMYQNGKSKGQRGSKWFERMKASHKDSLLKGAQAYALKNRKVVG